MVLMGGGVGGLGYGVIFCVHKHWWNDWAGYDGWGWFNGSTTSKGSPIRPNDLSNEKILERK